MGSSGTHRFTDYTEAAAQEVVDQSTGQSGMAGGSSSTGQDKCTKAFSAEVEEVARSAYFRKHTRVPPLRSKVAIVLGQRLEVCVDDLCVGYLPTSFNWLAQCIKEKGFNYEGVITRSRDTPLPTLSIDVAPTA